MKKYESLLESLRARLPEYMAQKRMVVGESGRKKIRCINPAHEDSTPSMSYHPASHQLHCFGCGVSYDIFDVIGMDYPNCDSFPRQVRQACELFGLTFPSDFSREGASSIKPPRLTARRSTDNRMVHTVVSLSTASAGEPPHPVSSALSRANPINHPQRMPTAQDRATTEAAQSIGTKKRMEEAADFTDMVRERLATHGAGGDYFYKRGLSHSLCEQFSLFEMDGRAYLPVFAGDRCIAYASRATSDETEPKHKNSAGGMGLFGSNYLQGEGKGGVLFITEGVFDALSAEACGYQAVALCGAGNVRRFLDACATNPTAAASYQLIAAGDMDAAGDKMNQALIEGLQGLGLRCGKLVLPDGCKDMNEALTGNRGALCATLDAAAKAEALEYDILCAASDLEALLDTGTRRASRNPIPTGYQGLDQLLDGGLYAGLYVIGAISSLGKTTFLLQMADQIAMTGGDVLFFSLEMSKFELMAKSLSRLSGDLDPLGGGLTQRQVMRSDVTCASGKGKQLLNDAADAYRTFATRLFLREGMADIGTLELRREIHRHIQARGKKPVVMIDYLQILKPGDGRATDKQNIDRAVVELKRISRDFDLPVVAISSFNRENYRNRVSMEAFKESGAVEYSSDVLIGMQLSGTGEGNFDFNEGKLRDPRGIELVVLKNRSGIPYGKAHFHYTARLSRFARKP